VTLAGLDACGPSGKVDLGVDRSPVTPGSDASTSSSSGFVDASTTDAPSAGSCQVTPGVYYPNGASWKCDCNSCGCDNGQVWSTLIGCIDDAGADAADDATSADASGTDAGTCTTMDPTACGAGMLCRLPTMVSATGTCAVDPSGGLANLMCATTDLNCYCQAVCGVTGCQQLVLQPTDGAAPRPSGIFCP
jgi:hypothetical protein